MQSDTIKLLASVVTAMVGAIGGSILLVFVAMQPGIEGKDGLMALLGGFIGASFTFLYTANAGTAAVRTFQSGLNTPPPGG
jgi:hypothetical protein